MSLSRCTRSIQSVRIECRPFIRCDVFTKGDDMQNRSIQRDAQGFVPPFSGDDATIRLRPFVDPQPAQKQSVHEAAAHKGKFGPTRTLKASAPPKIDVQHANFWYGSKHAL